MRSRHFRTETASSLTPCDCRNFIEIAVHVRPLFRQMSVGYQRCNAQKKSRLRGKEAAKSDVALGISRGGADAGSSTVHVLRITGEDYNDADDVKLVKEAPEDNHT